MIEVRCDRCGAFINRDTHVANKIRGRKERFNPRSNPDEVEPEGTFSFEVVNAVFTSADGAIHKVDLCASCVAMIARRRNV